MGVPTCFALHLEALHGFVAAEKVLDCAGHHMVDAGHTVGRRGPFEEYERGCTLAQCHTFLEKTGGIPVGKDFLIYIAEVQPRIFLEFFHWENIRIGIRIRTPQCDDS